MKKIFISLCLTLLLGGCHNQNNSLTKNSSQHARQQTLRINNHGPLPSLHPHTGVSLQCRIFQKALFEGLTRINADGQPELAAASHVDISPSQTVYTFSIRPMVWSNGEPVTAHHFEKAWKQAIAHDSPCLRSDLFYPIKNSRLAKQNLVSLDEVGVYAQDANTLVVELEHPTPYFFDLIANPLFSPLYDNTTIPSVFNGPFGIAQYDPDNQLILKKNNCYWDANAVMLETIYISFIADSTTAFALYEKNEIDWIGFPFINLPIDGISKIKNLDGYHSKPITATFWLSLNTEYLPLSSAKIRQALSMAINRKSLAEHVLIGEVPTKSIIPPSICLLDADELYPDNARKIAQDLFQKGLDELNLTLDTFPPLVFDHSDIPGQKKLAEAIQQCWEKTFSIKVQLRQSEWNVFFTNLGQHQSQIGGCFWYAAFKDPIYFLEFFKHKNENRNTAQWENEHYQQLLHLADLETNIQTRQEHLKQAEMLFLEQMPVIPLFIYNAQYLKQPYLKNLFVSDLGNVEFKWAYIAD